MIGITKSMWQRLSPAQKRMGYLSSGLMFLGGVALGIGTGRAMSGAPAASTALFALVSVGLALPGLIIAYRLRTAYDEMMRSVSERPLVWASHAALAFYVVGAWLQLVGFIAEIPLVAVVACWFAVAVVGSMVLTRKYEL